MTLKKCSKCQALNTTKIAKFIGRNEMGLHFNCLQLDNGEICSGTFFIRAKNWKEILESQMNWERALESTAQALMNRKSS